MLNELTERPTSRSGRTTEKPYRYRSDGPEPDQHHHHHRVGSGSGGGGGDSRRSSSSSHNSKAERQPKVLNPAAILAAAGDRPSSRTSTGSAKEKSSGRSSKNAAPRSGSDYESGFSVNSLASPFVHGSYGLPLVAGFSPENLLNMPYPSSLFPEGLGSFFSANGECDDIFVAGKRKKNAQIIMGFLFIPSLFFIFIQFCLHQPIYLLYSYNDAIFLAGKMRKFEFLRISYLLYSFIISLRKKNHLLVYFSLFDFSVPSNFFKTIHLVNTFHLSIYLPLDWLIDWLIDWFIDCSADWLIDFFISLSIDRLIGWLIDWLFCFILCQFFTVEMLCLPHVFLLNVVLTFFFRFSVSIFIQEHSMFFLLLPGMFNSSALNFPRPSGSSTPKSNPATQSESPFTPRWYAVSSLVLVLSTHTNLYLTSGFLTVQCKVPELKRYLSWNRAVLLASHRGQISLAVFY